MIMPEVDRNMKKLELSHIASRNGEWHKNVRKSFLVSYKIYFYIYSMTREFPTQYFPLKMKTYDHKETYSRTFREALFLIAPNWN